jgi:hypothetical protein
MLESESRRCGGTERVPVSWGKDNPVGSTVGESVKAAVEVRASSNPCLRIETWGTQSGGGR